MIKRTYFIKMELMPEYLGEEDVSIVTCQVDHYSLLSDPSCAQENAECLVCEEYRLKRHKYYTSAFNRL